jgi:hypothetical protein
MGISGGREAKRRALKILVFGIHPAEFAKVGLVSLYSMRMIPFPVNGYAGRKTCTGNRDFRFGEGEVG